MKKYLSILAIASALVSTSAMAQNQTDSLSKIEMNKIFDASQIENFQALELSNHEMKETQGAWVHFAGAGLVGGGFGYLNYVSSVPSHQRNFGGYATAIGSGAAGGVISVTPIGAARAAFMGGTVGYTGGQAAIRMR
ncbi:hypothetical protein ACSF3O_03155 [Acinetobacter soli]|uniref:hypothetical protein n=1 Tax=Acinetobacter soli TaxID=487316 RepID=UPI00258D0695|nr:hypothetical protein [uncultured Acinetobacter sp.]